ncbi:hypothetical protein SCHPADRAFT_903107 [Schizopora paradoxa]|uniref:Uncharacterized protein n=1 Tax=Schizopora paradoxa TaxID=27342 RepID=A0A0H2RS59_9AGAM|nr:hypothetical protein SCHPADRAFT_903107 [Schizopora paradoxa]
MHCLVPLLSDAKKYETYSTHTYRRRPCGHILRVGERPVGPQGNPVGATGPNRLNSEALLDQFYIRRARNWTERLDKFRYYVRSTSSSSGAPGRLDKVRLNHLLASEGDSSGNESSGSGTNVNEDKASSVTANQAHTGRRPHLGSSGVPVSRSSGYDAGQGPSSSRRAQSDMASMSYPAEMGPPFDQGSFHGGPYPGYPANEIYLHDANQSSSQSNFPSSGHNPGHFDAGSSSGMTPTLSDFLTTSGTQVTSTHEYEPIMLVVFIGTPPYTINHARKIPYARVASLNADQLLTFIANDEE